jgi:hypothetical protein
MDWSETFEGVVWLAIAFFCVAIMKTLLQCETCKERSLKRANLFIVEDEAKHSRGRRRRRRGRKVVKDVATPSEVKPLKAVAPEDS